jgi:hypothetical protein
MASNPLNARAERVTWSDHVSLAAFVAVLRLFLILELEMLRTGSRRPRALVAITCAIALGIFAFTEAVASRDRHELVRKSQAHVSVVLRTELACLINEAAYVVLSLFYAIVAVIERGAEQPTCSAFLAVAVVLAGGATLVRHVVFVWLGMLGDSLVPEMVFFSVHVALAALAIFLMHAGADGGHKEMAEHKPTDHFHIDVDEGSDDGDEQ